MATRQGIDATAAVRLAEEHAHMVFAIKAEFDTSDILLHTGLGDLNLPTGSGNANESYTGAGTLLSVSDIEDTQDLSSTGVVFQLSGMNETVLNYALVENYQNRPISLFLAFIDAGSDTANGVMTVYRGRMTSMAITDSPEAGINITLSTENRLVDLRRPSNIRYTSESQAFLFSNDTGFDAVEKAVDLEILWGRKNAVGGSVDGRATEERESYRRD